MMNKPDHKNSIARTYLLEHLPKNATGAEIGVYMGNFANRILSIADPKKLYLIDPWKIILGVGYDNGLYGKNTTTQNKLDDMYLSVISRFQENTNVEIIRDLSVNAASQIPDESLDYIYIDGDHTYKGVCLDFDSYYPKLKPNGLIYGDDYTARHWFGTGVIDALHKNLVEKNLRLVFLNEEQYCCRKV